MFFSRTLRLRGGDTKTVHAHACKDSNQTECSCSFTAIRQFNVATQVRNSVPAFFFYFLLLLCPELGPITCPGLAHFFRFSFFRFSESQKGDGRGNGEVIYFVGG